MRIALDGSDLAADRVEGPSVYAGELLPRLTSLLRSRGHQVTTYLPSAPRGVTVAGETRVIPGKPFWTQRVFAAALWRDRPDVLFMPIQMLPLLRPRTLKTVAVVHDLEFLHYPETYTFSNRALLRFFTRHAVRNATQLVAVSQYTKDDVVRTYGRSPREITVVHHGVAAERFQKAMGREDLDVVRRRYQLPERYVLFVGALQPRKNIAGLLAAFEEVRRSDLTLHLVLVSGGEWKSTSLLMRIETSSARQALHRLRRVPSNDLPALYRMASVFVLPSFSEGFGMPVLEAMAAGTPLVTSSTSALPEVAGSAALFVNPEHPPEMAQAILDVLQNASLREDVISRGQAHASRFTWERAAEQTAAVIENAAA